jgi:uncharacterized protein
MGQKPARLRIVLDTNALVSALLFGGEPGRIVSLWHKRRLVLLVSRDVLLEYVRVLGYPKFALDAQDIKGLIEEHVLPFAEMVDVTKTPRVVREDPGDDKFLALVAASRADYLASGDKHLLALVKYHRADILTPRQFLDRPELSGDKD